MLSSVRTLQQVHDNILVKMKETVLHTKLVIFTQNNTTKNKDLTNVVIHSNLIETEDNTASSSSLTRSMCSSSNTNLAAV